MDDRDVDAAFEAIIAGWDDPLTPGAEGPGGPTDALSAPYPSPDASAGDGPAEPATPPTPPLLPQPFGGWRVNPPLLPLSGTEPGPADQLDSDEDDEHFVPPEVHLPPQEDVHFWGIVAGLVGGPLMLIWLVVVRGDGAGSWWVAGAVALTLAGFVLLVLRQPAHRDPTDDDGARL